MLGSHKQKATPRAGRQLAGGRGGRRAVVAVVVVEQSNSGSHVCLWKTILWIRGRDVVGSDAMCRLHLVVGPGRVESSHVMSSQVEQ